LKALRWELGKGAADNVFNRGKGGDASGAMVNKISYVI
jgi:hypothetical protein